VTPAAVALLARLRRPGLPEVRSAVNDNCQRVWSAGSQGSVSRVPACWRLSRLRCCPARRCA